MPLLVVDDVLAAMRHTMTTTPVPTTTSSVAADGGGDESGLLQDLWWWLLLSKGANACLAFLDRHDLHHHNDYDYGQHDDRSAADGNRDGQEEEGGERAEVFLALAPAVLHWLLQKSLTNAPYDEELRVRLRVQQACRRRCNGTRQTKQQDDCQSTHDVDGDRQVELVRILVRCLKAVGGQLPQEYTEWALGHSSGSIVLGTHTTHTCMGALAFQGV
jgi:hypothetical protein